MINENGTYNTQDVTAIIAQVLDKMLRNIKYKLASTNYHKTRDGSFDKNQIFNKAREIYIDVEKAIRKIEKEGGKVNCLQALITTIVRRRLCSENRFVLKGLPKWKNNCALEMDTLKCSLNDYYPENMDTSDSTTGQTKHIQDIQNENNKIDNQNNYYQLSPEDMLFLLEAEGYVVSKCNKRQRIVFNKLVSDNCSQKQIALDLSVSESQITKDKQKLEAILKQYFNFN